MAAATAVRAQRPPLATPFFYGWLVVAMTVVAGLVGSGVDHVAFGVVFKPMSDDLGWNRSVVSGAVAAGTVLAGLAAPFMGALADRLGPRLLISGGALLTGIFVAGMALAVEPWQFYAAYAPARAIANTTLAGVVSLTAVANWFRVKRPRAIGFVSMASPVGAALMAQLYQATLANVGWRGAFVAVAALLVVTALPAAVLLRRQPEDLGLLPDGAPATPSGATATAPTEEASWSPRQAMGTAAFWLIIGSFMLAALSIGTIGFHLVAYLTDTGIEPALAANLLSIYALSGGAAIVLWGFMAERVQVRYLSVGILALSAVAVVLLLNISGPASALAFALLYGFTARSQSTLVQMLLASYYGRRFFGAISGITVAFQLGVMGVSPWIAALVFDLTGSYQTIFTLFVGLYGLSAVCMLLARRPRVPMADTAV